MMNFHGSFGRHQNNGNSNNFLIAVTKEKYKEDSSSTSSSISHQEMERIVDKLKSGRCRDTTKKNYLAIWRIFNQFFIKLDDKPSDWESRLTLFVGYLVNSNHKSATIRSYISVIKAVLRDEDILLNEDRYLLNSLTKSCRLQNDRVFKRFAIQKGLLNLIIKELEVILDKQPYLEILDIAIISTLYYGMFRIGELTDSQHAVKVGDVHIGKNKKKIMFILRSSKTHGKGDFPQIIKICGKEINRNDGIQNIDTDVVFNNCPFAILRKFVGMRPPKLSEDEEFFIFKDYSAVTAQNVRKVLKEAIKNIGLKDSLYNTHSLRAGRSVDLQKWGFSVDVIWRLGRWSSNAVFDYLKT